MDGVLYIALVIAIAAVPIAVVLHARALAELGRRLGVRLGVVAPPPEPLPEPVEKVARDVLRIRTDLVLLDPHTPVARRRGLLAAYDDALGDACRAMGLGDRMGDLPEGVEREIARLETEDLLVSAGLIPGRTPGR